ncbi:MAG TPA: 3-dehydroquinate synthase [Caulobacterales bacterium]|nr:3-dehydroquinate synthase [Caulobacterales bacterium]
MTQTETVRVELGARSYDVLIGAGLLARAGELIAPFAPSKRVFVVADKTVAGLHGDALSQSLEAAGLAVHGFMLPPGEEQKSFAGLMSVTTSLLQANIARNDLVIAFGGGVIGDLAGFAAGIVKRGVDFVQIPTTLLAQVDSSVGGKTAIDTPEGKNLVGVFHQPRLVLADLDVLATLPQRELRAGYAEVVKYGLIDDFAFFEWCEENAQHILGTAPIPFDPGGHHDGVVAVNEMMQQKRREALTYAVKTSVAAKARIVGEDEHERSGGPRALLNLGHTFAHALETKVGYSGALLHGEAVGTGMALAFAFSAALGLCPRQDAERVRAHLEATGFVTDVRKLPQRPDSAEEFLALMAHDKKAEAGKLTLILAHGVGEAFVQKGADAAALKAFLTEALA